MFYSATLKMGGGPLTQFENRQSTLQLCSLRHEDIRESGGIAPTFLTSALDGGEWSASRPCRFTPGEVAPGTHGIGGWVGPRVGLGAVEKRNILLCRESNPDRPARRSTD
jgi:hypothetical protein